MNTRPKPTNGPGGGKATVLACLISFMLWAVLSEGLHNHIRLLVTTVERVLGLESGH